jgi:DNA-binding LytR/AlgR family response regulator
MNATPLESDTADAACSRAGPAPTLRRRWISGQDGRMAKLFAIDDVLVLDGVGTGTRVVSVAGELRSHEPLLELAAALDPGRYWRIDTHVIVRADAIARARRDALGHVTLQLRQRPETLPVGEAYAWRFEPC